MIIHWIRHTTPDVAPGVCYGQTDLDVVSTFSEEVAVVKSKLHEHYDQVFSSPLLRCTKLAAACSTRSAVVEPRLMEYHFGDWEGRPWEDIKGQYATNWFEDFVNVPSPNGENLMEMQRRVLAFYHELLRTGFDTVAIFTHSGVQRIIHAEILSTPLTDIFRLQLDYGAVIESKHDAKSGAQSLKHL